MDITFTNKLRAHYTAEVAATIHIKIFYLPSSSKMNAWRAIIFLMFIWIRNLVSCPTDRTRNESVWK